MRLLPALLALLLLRPAPQSAPTLLRFGHLWDGTRLLDDVVVTVEGGRIASVTAAAEIAAGRRDRPAALHGDPGPHRSPHARHLLLGSRSRHAAARRPRRRPAVTVFLAQDNARRTLETGVTTIRDLGASGETDFAMRDLIAMGAMTGPRMFVAGQGISAGRGGAPDPDGDARSTPRNASRPARTGSRSTARAAASTASTPPRRSPSTR